MSNLITGPQFSTGDWFDTTLLAQARKYGEWFPAEPPPKPTEPAEPQRVFFRTDEEFLAAYDAWSKAPAIAAWVELTDLYINTNYYDLARTLYIAHARTGDQSFLGLARKVADSWWQSPYFKGGAERNGDGISPKFSGLAGLMLRAGDGRPEMWDGINSFTRYFLDIWVIGRMNATRTAPDPARDVHIREGAFALHFAIWLSQVLPDSFPLTAGGVQTNGAAIRARYLADAENAAVNYFGKLQNADGSWTWDDWYSYGPDGSLLKGIEQPFMVGMLTRALCDLHVVSTNPTVKESVKNQICNACRHLHSGGPFTKGIATNFKVEVGGFHYAYHGGTELNPTLYAKGDFPFNTVEAWHVSSARQLMGTSIGSFAYAYLISGDSYFKDAGEELYKYAYSGFDGFRSMMNDSDKAKLLNQHVLGTSNYKAWLSQATGQPLPQPEPVPLPTPIPAPQLPAPSADGTKGTTVIDAEHGVWTLEAVTKRTLRDNVWMGGGQGQTYKIVNSIVYTLGLDNQWYQWAKSNWSHIGSEPGMTVVEPPVPTPTPTPTPIPTPATRTVSYPPVKQLAKRNAVIETQWLERYRLKKENSDGTAVFEKVV